MRILSAHRRAQMYIEALTDFNWQQLLLAEMRLKLSWLIPSSDAPSLLNTLVE